MLTWSCKAKCDRCGQWIAYKDLEEKTAIHIMLTPGAAKSRETWKSLCQKCNKPKEEDRHATVLEIEREEDEQPN